MNFEMNTLSLTLHIDQYNCTFLPSQWKVQRKRLQLKVHDKASVVPCCWLHH